MKLEQVWGGLVLLLLLFLLVIGLVASSVICQVIAFGERRKLARMSPEERAIYLAAKRQQEMQRLAEQEEQKLLQEWGPLNPAMLCPHCQQKGCIRTKKVLLKKGISGGKATAALLTSGFSVLLTGLSRMENCTQAHCCNCKNDWVF